VAGPRRSFTWAAAPLVIRTPLPTSSAEDGQTMSGCGLSFCASFASSPPSARVCTASSLESTLSASRMSRGHPSETRKFSEANKQKRKCVCVCANVVDVLRMNVSVGCIVLCGDAVFTSMERLVEITCAGHLSNLRLGVVLGCFAHSI